MLVGAIWAILMATAGASMLMIRPPIRANDNHPHVVHAAVFFIFVEADTGGTLTPLGDPRCYSVLRPERTSLELPFTQCLRILFVFAALLTIFFVFDTWYNRTDGVSPRDPMPRSTGWPRRPSMADDSASVLPSTSIARFEALFKTINERLAQHAARRAAPFR